LDHFAPYTHFLGLANNTCTRGDSLKVIGGQSKLVEGRRGRGDSLKVDEGHRGLVGSQSSSYLFIASRFSLVRDEIRVAREP